MFLIIYIVFNLFRHLFLIISFLFGAYNITTFQTFFFSLQIFPYTLSLLYVKLMASFLLIIVPNMTRSICMQLVCVFRAELSVWVTSWCDLPQGRLFLAAVNVPVVLCVGLRPPQLSLSTLACILLSLVSSCLVSHTGENLLVQLLIFEAG